MRQVELTTATVIALPHFEIEAIDFSTIKSELIEDNMFVGFAALQEVVNDLTIN
mgnify:CR=1 FL=1